jgi:hypothetical protein
VLVVMPNGLGFGWWNHDVAHEYALLEKIPVRRGGPGMVAAAATGVARLAADAGVTIEPAPPAPSPATHTNRDRVSILVVAVAALALAGLLREGLRRRRKAA